MNKDKWQHFLTESLVTYYHGSARKFNIGDIILPPTEHGQSISELGRKKNLNKVFFTKDIGSAKIYAQRAVNSYGGTLYVYRVKPLGQIEILNNAAGTSVLMCDRLEIVEIVIG